MLGSVRKVGSLTTGGLQTTHPSPRTTTTPCPKPPPTPSNAGGGPPAAPAPRHLNELAALCHGEGGAADQPPSPTSLAAELLQYKSRIQREQQELRRRLEDQKRRYERDMRQQMDNARGAWGRATSGHQTSGPPRPGCILELWCRRFMSSLHFFFSI